MGNENLAVQETRTNLRNDPGDRYTWEPEKVKDPNDEMEYRKADPVNLFDEHDEVRWMEKVLDIGDEPQEHIMTDDYLKWRDTKDKELREK